MSTPPAPAIALTGTDPGPGQRVPGPATAAPHKAHLSTDGEEKSGEFRVTVEVQRGQNAQTVALLEGGREVARRDVVDATPAAQSTTFDLTGVEPGKHVYTAVLTHQHGTSTTRPLTVVVKG
ncbi:hypothetical protein GTR00_07875 [Kineococcus sp. T90]|nr:hypothetical protein [Kineococcus indalonis]